MTFVTITAIPDEGYIFENWVGDLLGGRPNPFSMRVGDPITIEAVFVQSDARYNLVCNVTPQDAGKVKLTQPQPPEGFRVNARVLAEAVPSAGYKFSHWEGDLTGILNQVSVTMDTNKRTTAVFNALYSLAVNVAPICLNEEWGWVTLEPPQPPEGYLDSTTVTLTAIPAEGYEFDHWSGAISGSQNPATMIITSHSEVTAHFAKPSTFQAWWILLPVSLLFLTLLAGLVTIGVIRAKRQNAWRVE